MNNAEIDLIHELLGPRAVLLPIKKGTKHPTLKQWAKLRYEDTMLDNYRKKLIQASAIGVSLGAISDGIVTIDCDSLEFQSEMLRLNPQLASTLRTVGARGCNFWLRMAGTYPPTKHLKNQDGQSLGEWRSDSGQTLIAGRHPSGGRYRFVKEVSPILLSFGQLVWPDQVQPPRVEAVASPPPSLSLSSPSSLPSAPSIRSTPSIRSAPSIPLHDRGRNSLKESLIQESGAADELRRDARLKRLYSRFVEKVFVAKQGSRNADLVQMATFLFHAVTKEQALQLCSYFYRLNSSVFVDPLEQHLNEAEAHLLSVEEGWWQSLKESEISFLDGLPPNYVGAYRILRDLASQELDDFPLRHFCMSEDQLGLRLGIHARQAGRILGALAAQDVIEILSKGERRAELARMGVKRPAKATTWKWMFPISEIGDGWH